MSAGRGHPGGVPGCSGEGEAGDPRNGGMCASGEGEGRVGGEKEGKWERGSKGKEGRRRVRGKKRGE